MSGYIEVVLDVTGMHQPPSTAQEFGALWVGLEQALRQRNLRDAARHRLGGPAGEIVVEVTRTTAEVEKPTEATRFKVVGVRESPKIRYACATCRDGGHRVYGPFKCVDCEDDARSRVCDEHAIILDGSLLTACPTHRPACSEASCQRRATFRCGGRGCMSRRPWCDAHRVRHPHDADRAYCPSCFAVAFPRCEHDGCTRTGTAACEYVDGAGHRCGRRTCPKHTSRWQVYGPERLGLARCASHRKVAGTPSSEVVRQIVLASSLRRPMARMPRLGGFAHNVRKAGDADAALDKSRLLREAVAVRAQLEQTLRGKPLQDALRRFDKQQKEWEGEGGRVVALNEQGTLLLQQLKQLVLAQDARFGAAIADGLILAEYIPPRTKPGQERQGLLFVRLPEGLRGAFVGKGGARITAYSSQLGVKVGFDDGGRRR